VDDQECDKCYDDYCGTDHADALNALPAEQSLSLTLSLQLVLASLLLTRLVPRAATVWIGWIGWIGFIGLWGLIGS
jgi:hypothetical protein